MEKGQRQTQVSSAVPSIQTKANGVRPQHFSLPSKSDPAVAGGYSHTGDHHYLALADLYRSAPEGLDIQ